MSQRARTEDLKVTREQIPGYDYGKPASARSPVSLEELRQLEEATGWTAEDAAVLARRQTVFVDRAESDGGFVARGDCVAAAPDQMVFRAGREAR